MNTPFKGLATVVSLALFGMLAPRDVSATTFLLYEGQTYTSVHNDPQIDGEYQTFMRVTGWVELADPLDPNCVCSFTFGLDGLSDGLLGFSFFDGVWVYGLEPPSTMGIEDAAFAFSTDAAGDIVGWDVFMSNLLAPGVPSGGGDLDVQLSSIIGDWGQLVCDNCDPVLFQRFESGIGRWTVHTTVPELSSSLSLLLVGLAGIGLGLRKYSRA